MHCSRQSPRVSFASLWRLQLNADTFYRPVEPLSRGPASWSQVKEVSRRKMRKLVLGPKTYLWCVSHRHIVDGPRRSDCTEVFTVYLDGYSRAPARVLFPETADHGPGYVANSGEVFDYERPNQAINLNTPRVARLIVEVTLEAGWDPKADSRDFEISNGFLLLRAHPKKVEETLGDATGA